MPGEVATAGSPAPTQVSSIERSLCYLEQQTWWPAFREGRRTSLTDDALWVGHFCGWLQLRHVGIERCTRTDLDAYLASTASFRPGPRAACERTVTALVDFFAGLERGRSRPLDR